MSPKRVARAFGLVGAVTLAVIVVVTVRVVRERSVARTLTRAAGLMPGALLHAHNFHWTEMKGDQSQWVLQAKDASYAADKTNLSLTDAKLAMTDQAGKHLDLTAPQARLVLDGNHIRSAELLGGIVINYNGFVIKTAQATFFPDKDEVDAPGAVEIEGQGLDVNGIGLMGHPKAEVFQLLKQVTTRIVPKHNRAASKIS